MRPSDPNADVVPQRRPPRAAGGPVRPLARAAHVLALAYLVALLMLSWIQTQLIFPGQSTQGHPTARLTPPPGCSLVRLPTRLGPDVTALFGPALTADGRARPDAAACPTILYFYGNGMCLAHCLDEFDAFRRLGANVLIPDYLGYGLSGGQAGEDACYATADACNEHLMNRLDVAPGRLVLAGWSLGGAVAIDLAARRPVAGLAVFSTFTGMEQVVAGLMPWAPAGWLLRHRFESESKIGRVRCPILVGHSRHDELIPFAMSERLARAAAGDVTTVTVDGAPHNAFFARGGRAVLGALAGLLDRATRPVAPEPAIRP